MRLFPTLFFACASLFLLLVNQVALQAAEKKPSAPAHDEPELDNSQEPSTPKQVNADDTRTIDRLLLNAVTRDISSDEVESLRRIRNFLRHELQRKPKPSSEQSAVLNRLKLLLEKQVRKARHARPARWQLAMFHVLQEDWETALKHLTRMGPASSRDLYHPLLLAYVYLHLMDYRNADQEMQRLETLMQAHRDLQLSRPVLCSAVNAYRIYQPLTGKLVKPGQNILVYVEISGVAFRLSTGNIAGCDLGFGLSIKDEASQVFWAEPDYGNYAPRFRGPVRDMHASISLRIPVHLAPGRYFLVIRCHDRISNKKGECAVGFTIGGAGQVHPSKPRASIPGNPNDTTQERKLRAERELLRKRSRTKANAFEPGK